MKEFKCKDCIHYCVCKDTVTEDNWTDDTPIEIREIFSPKYCEYFFLAADLIPVKHGEWIAKIHNDGLGNYTLYHCSICDCKKAYESRYCQDCGAHMDGGKNNE